jgi:hypothetical protein
MTRARRSNDWGFPRWRAYDGARGAPEALRPCDREGCGEPGTCPAPKAPNRPDRWWFCERHAAEYNRGWDYFAALDAEGAASAEQAEARETGRFRRASHWDWGEGDGTRSRAEQDALKVLCLPTDATDRDVKAAYRREAKANHPDLNPGDAGAADRFRAAQAAYAVLQAADERRRSEKFRSAGKKKG